MVYLISLELTEVYTMGHRYDDVREEMRLSALGFSCTNRNLLSNFSLSS